MESRETVDEDLAFFSGAVCFAIGVVQILYSSFVLISTIFLGLIAGVFSIIFGGLTTSANKTSQIPSEYILMKVIALNGGVFAIGCFFVAIQFFWKKKITLFGIAFCIVLSLLNAILHLLVAIVFLAFVYLVVAVVFSVIAYLNIRAGNRVRE